MPCSGKYPLRISGSEIAFFVSEFEVNEAVLDDESFILDRMAMQRTGPAGMHQQIFRAVQFIVDEPYFPAPKFRNFNPVGHGWASGLAVICAIRAIAAWALVLARNIPSRALPYRSSCGRAARAAARALSALARRMSWQNIEEDRKRDREYQRPVLPCTLYRP